MNCAHKYYIHTATVVDYSDVKLRCEWFVTAYTYIYPNTSLRQFNIETEISLRTVFQHITLRAWCLSLTTQG